jgi:hypothetical protein
VKRNDALIHMLYSVNTPMVLIGAKSLGIAFTPYQPDGFVHHTVYPGLSVTKDEKLASPLIKPTDSMRMEFGFGMMNVSP